MHSTWFWHESFTYIYDPEWILRLCCGLIFLPGRTVVESMEDTLEKLNEDADMLVEFAAENDYLDTAFYNILGERLMHQGYVDASYILEASSVPCGG